MPAEKWNQFSPSVCHPGANNSTYVLECLKDFIRIWHHTFQKPKQRTDATQAKDFHRDVMTAHLVLPSPDLQTFSLDFPIFHIWGNP